MDDGAHEATGSWRQTHCRDCDDWFVNGEWVPNPVMLEELKRTAAEVVAAKWKEAYEKLATERDRLRAVVERDHAREGYVKATNAADAAAEAVGAMAEKLSTVLAENARLRAALEVIAAPDVGATDGCQACRDIARLALDGHLAPDRRDVIMGGSVDDG